jgi:hypothetical protein
LKKIVTILLLVILLVNAAGYRFIMSYMENKANRQMITRLDNNEYNESELIEIAAPLDLPYFTNWQHFERCDGQVTINGTVYNYVARKYVNNVMTYKCIPNKAQQNIITAKKQIEHIAFSDGETGKSKKPDSPLSSYFKNMPDYDDNCGRLTQPGITVTISNRYPSFTAALYFTQKETQHRPPGAALQKV